MSKVVIIRKPLSRTGSMIAKLENALATKGFDEGSALKVSDPKNHGDPLLFGTETIIMFTSPRFSQVGLARSYLENGYRVLLFHFAPTIDFYLDKNFDGSVLQQKIVFGSEFFPYKITDDLVSWIIDA